MNEKKKKKDLKLLDKLDCLIADDRNEGGYYHKQMIVECRMKIKAIKAKIGVL